MNIPAWSPSSSSSSSLKCRACLFFFSTLITPAATVTADVAVVVVVTVTDEVVSVDDLVLDGLSVVVEVADCDSSCVSFVDLEICVRLSDLSSDSL